MAGVCKIVAALAIPTAAGAVVVAGAGSASAATPVSGNGYAGVILDHHETVIAGQVNADNLINAAFGDSWTVDLPDDSIWHTGDWTPITGDQFVDEAASHPGGRIELHLIDPAINHAQRRNGGSSKQDPRHIAALDLLERDFTPTAPNTKWVADLTRILTGEKVLWLASVRDAFSNKAVDWRCGPRPDTDLVLSVLDYALFSRDVRGGESIFHSGKGR